MVRKLPGKPSSQSACDSKVLQCSCNMQAQVIKHLASPQPHMHPCDTSMCCQVYYTRCGTSVDPPVATSYSHHTPHMSDPK
jgi:hypothetical protein